MEKTKGGNMVDKTVPRANKSVVITFRLFQAFCFGVFALGLSMMAGDYGSYIKSPFSTLSLITTIFGLLGSIISGILAKQAENW